MNSLPLSESMPAMQDGQTLASLGVTSLSKSQVSAMARDLDDQVRQFRTRRLYGPYMFVAAADALVIKVREGGRVVGTHSSSPRE